MKKQLVMCGEMGIFLLFNHMVTGCSMEIVVGDDTIRAQWFRS